MPQGFVRYGGVPRSADDAYYALPINGATGFLPRTALSSNNHIDPGKRRSLKLRAGWTLGICPLALLQVCCPASPLAAMAAVALVSASGVLGVGGGPHFFRRCQQERCRASRLCAAGWCAGWLPLGFSCGAAEHHHLLFRQHTGAGAASKQHRQQTPAASPTKKSTLEAPADLLAALPVLRRESPVAVVAVPPRRRCLPERTPAPPHLCCLFPCADHTSTGRN
jgi:hypothetical protein